MFGVLVNIALESIEKAIYVALFKVLFMNRTERTEKNHGNLRQDSRSPGRMFSQPSRKQVCASVLFTNVR
jgi:hypothetical protein